MESTTPPLHPQIQELHDAVNGCIQSIDLATPFSQDRETVFTSVYQATVDEIRKEFFNNMHPFGQTLCGESCFPNCMAAREMMVSLLQIMNDPDPQKQSAWIWENCRIIDYLGKQPNMFDAIKTNNMVRVAEIVHKTIEGMSPEMFGGDPVLGAEKKQRYLNLQAPLKAAAMTQWRVVDPQGNETVVDLSNNVMEYIRNIWDVARVNMLDIYVFTSIFDVAMTSHSANTSTDDLGKQVYEKIRPIVEVKHKEEFIQNRLNQLQGVPLTEDDMKAIENAASQSSTRYMMNLQDIMSTVPFMWGLMQKQSLRTRDAITKK